jgi:DNA-nicking Smr family endonuclease
VRVITGRGRGRAAGGVLQREVPGWLAAPPLAAWVLAFASAPASEGGAGALRILLRS